MLVAVTLLAAAVAAGPARDPRLVLLDAMAQENARAMARLRLAGYDAPYYLAQQLKDFTRLDVAGRYGALTEDAARHDRKLRVDVRVGSYDLDSSGRDEGTFFFADGDPQTWTASRDAPLDDDPQALRNALWLLADERYKEALSSFFKRRSRSVYRPDDPQRAPSFTREPPQRHVDPPSALAFDRARWQGEVRRLTALFRGHPALLDGSVHVTAQREVRWLTSSEGTALVTESTLLGVQIEGTARAPDGQLLEDSRTFYAPTEARLPPGAVLEAAVRQLVGELEALRAAPAIDPFTGPAILAPEAAGVLFHEAVGHRLEGDRQDDDREGQTFKGQLGQAILPSFLGVADDPTLREAGGAPLNGAYAYDDQGVPAQRAVLVEDGVLRGYLLSRRPVLPFAHSNGHGRSQGVAAPTARMANLLVSARRGVPMAELKRMLLAEARRQGKRYGLLLRDIAGGDTTTEAGGYQAFKGTPRVVYRIDADTGKEELVRGVELVGTPLASIGKVIAAGDAVGVFNGYCGAESGFVPVSTVAPAVLVSEIELQRATRSPGRAPILPAPWNETP